MSKSTKLGAGQPAGGDARITGVLLDPTASDWTKRLNQCRTDDQAVRRKRSDL
jgi:hypothetical protein